MVVVGLKSRFRHYCLQTFEEHFLVLREWLPPFRIGGQYWAGIIGRLRCNMKLRPFELDVSNTSRLVLNDTYISRSEIQ